jgi:hypothetical protein
VDGETAVAIVGIIVAGIIGPWLTARWASGQQRRAQSHERALGDLQDLRAVLGKAGVALTEVEIAAASALAYLMAINKQGQNASHEIQDSFARSVDEFWNGLHEARAAGEEIVIRLGKESPTVNEYARALAAMEEAGGLLAEEQPVTQERTDGLFKPFGTAREAFVNAAAEVVGSQLPPSTGS